MTIHVSLVGRKDLKGEVYRQLRAAIRTGQLRPGEYLTPSRELAGIGGFAQHGGRRLRSARCRRVLDFQAGGLGRS
jgi:hypothetical protein